MKRKIEYSETPAFLRDLKKLSKRFPSLDDDLAIAKKNAIELFHREKIDTNAVFELSHMCSNDVRICKLKKFACRSLKGRGVRSGIRIIYAFYPLTYHIVFIQIYIKSNREREDEKRIITFLKKE